MKTRISIIMIAFAFLLSGCDGLWPCLEGDGDITTEERLGGTFKSVESDVSFDVTIRNGATYSLKVISDQNLLNYIETNIVNGKLVISVNHDGCIEFSPETEVVITAPEISNIILSGSGNIEMFDMSAMDFKAQNSGSGRITLRELSVENTIIVDLIGSGNVWLKGRAQDASYYLSGSGTIDAESMRVFDCTANNSGSGNIHAFVYDYLEATLSGSGHIYYYGNTSEVLKHNSGSGDIIDASK